MNKLEKFYFSMFVTIVLSLISSVLIKNEFLFVFSLTSCFWVLLTYATFDFKTKEVMTSK